MNISYISVGRNIKLYFNLFISVILLVVIGWIYTNSVYTFGKINHIEQLPHIYAQQNSVYLINDFFVNYTRSVNPRYYYAKLIAIVSRNFGLETTFYILTNLCNISILLITFFLVYHFSKSIKAIVAPILLLSLSGFANLGGAGTITDVYFLPQLFVMPLLLLSVLIYLINNKLFWISILLVCTAIPYHPSAAILVLLTIFLTQLIRFYLFLYCIEHSQLEKIKKAILKLISFGIIIFIIYQITTVIFCIPRSSIQHNEHIKILAEFRHPHHYLFSHFKTADKINFYYLSIVIFCCIQFLKESKTSTYNIVLMLFSVSLILVIGILPEIFDNLYLKKFIDLQPFRIIFLFRWLSFIIISITLIKLFYHKTLHFFICLLLLSYSLIVSQGYSFARFFRPNINYTISANKSGLFDYIKNNTDSDSTFLTPNDFGDLRISPGRSIVVDYKSYPFNHYAEQEWYDRINRIYGGKDNSKYSNITDIELINLKDAYTFTYAILFNCDRTSFKVLYQDNYYCMIEL